MSASQRILSCALTLTTHSTSFVLLPPPTSSFRSYLTLARSRSRSLIFMPHYKMQRRGGQRQQQWKQKRMTDTPSSSVEVASSSGVEAVTNGITGLSIAENNGQSSVPSIGFGSFQQPNQGPTQGQKAVWKSKSYGTVRGPTSAELGDIPADDSAAAIKGNASEVATAQNSSLSLSKLFRGNLLENFTVDNSTYSLAEIRATFYPKFENEKSDQELRTRMIEMVSKGLAVVEIHCCWCFCPGTYAS